MINLTLISPDVVREFCIEWIEITTTTGNRVILPGHAPLVEQLVPKKTVTMKLPGGALKTIVLENGIVSITRDAILIVLEV
jgi:F0F1-type ATP synthase epsilon subunit